MHSQTTTLPQEVAYLNTLFQKMELKDIQWQMAGEQGMQSTPITQENVQKAKKALIKLGVPQSNIAESEVKSDADNPHFTLLVPKLQASNILNRDKANSIYTFIKLYAKHAIQDLKMFEEKLEAKDFGRQRVLVNNWPLLIFHPNTNDHSLGIGNDNGKFLDRYGPPLGEGLPTFICYPYANHREEFSADAVKLNLQLVRAPLHHHHRRPFLEKENNFFGINPSLYHIPNLEILAHIALNPAFDNAQTLEERKKEIETTLEPRLFKPVRETVLEYTQDPIPTQIQLLIANFIEKYRRQDPIMAEQRNIEITTELDARAVFNLLKLLANYPQEILDEQNTDTPKPKF